MNLDQRWDAERALYAAVGNAPDLASLATLATVSAERLHGAAYQRFREAVRERYVQMVARALPHGAR